MKISVKYLNFYEKIFELSGKNFAAPSSGVLDCEKKSPDF